MENVLTACATRGAKPVNQDDCRSSSNAIVVADGLGSFFQAEVASKFAANALIDKIQAAIPADLNNAHWYKDAFASIQHDLQNSPLADLKTVPSSHPLETSFGTTLLCATAQADTLTMAYVGNGAILHLRGGFDEFPESMILPWNAINYLNPHSIPQEGKNAMTRFIAPISSELQRTPTVIQLQQDRQGTGDILVVCSDGIHAADQVRIGRDAERNIWISGDEPLVLLYKHLAAFFKQPDHSVDGLLYHLECYLDAMSVAQLITDDCSIGVLVTPSALAYYAPKEATVAPETAAEQPQQIHGAN